MNGHEGAYVQGRGELGVEDAARTSVPVTSRLPRDRASALLLQSGECYARC